MAEAIVFYVFGGMAVIAALFMITRQSPVASAFSLIVVMIALAGLFVSLSATFVAAMQVIVYAGAVMVLFLFVIMLLNLRETDFGKHKITGTKVFGALMAFVVLTVLIMISWIYPGADEEVELTFGQVAPVAKALFGTYALPFEITSILLLAAIIGAVVMARKETGKEDGK